MSEKHWLQFFAEGAGAGDGGEGGEAATGEQQAADAGRETGRTLEELGVPRDKAERYRQRMAKRKDAEQAGQAAAAAEEKKEDGGKDPWDSFFSDPKNKERLEQMMAARGKSATEAKQAAAAQMEKLNPVLKLLGEKYGLQAGEDGSYDLDALTKAVESDDSYYEDKALEMGVSVEVARKLEQAEEMERQQKARDAKMRREAMLQQHFRNVQEQARKLQEVYPGFDLEKELKDPEFVKRTAPGGMSVEDAWFSLRHGDIMRQQAENISRKAKENAAAVIRSGSERPRENGSSATAAASAAPNMRNMSRDERLAYIRNKYPPRK